MKRKIKNNLTYFFLLLLSVIVQPLFTIESVAAISSSTSSFKLILRTKNDNNLDTIKLVYWDHYFSDKLNSTFPYKELSVVSQNGIFEFNVPGLKDAFYFCLLKNDNSTIPNVTTNAPMLGAPDDYLECQINNGVVSFLGKRAELYNMQLEIRRLEHVFRKTWLGGPRANFNAETFLKYYKSNVSFNKTMLEMKLSFLNAFQTKISPAVFDKLRVDFIGKSNTLQLENYLTNVSELNAGKFFKTDSLKLSLKKLLINSLLSDGLFLDNDIKDSIAAESKDYISYLLLKEQVFFNGTLYRDVFSAIKSGYTGLLRDNLLTFCVMKSYANGLENADSLLNETLNIVKTNYSLQILNNLTLGFSKGKVAYDFHLPDTKGNLVKLSDFKGKIVIMDFWFTGCVGCIQYYKDVLKPVKSSFKNNPNLVFISISIDKDKDIWKSSLANGAYTSVDAVNLLTEGKGANHEVIRNYNVQSFPTIILIDKQGKFISNNGTDLKNDKLLQMKLENALN